VFLVNRSEAGRTAVHSDECPSWGSKSTSRCECPLQMAFATLRSLKFTLQGAFRDAGRVGIFDPRSGSGNPCQSPRIDNLLYMIEKQQCAAGTTQLQAALIDESVFDRIMLTVQTQWMRATQQGALKEAVLYARDAALYALLWQSGLRAGEALRLNANQVTLFRTKEHYGAYVAVGVAKAHQSFRVTISTDFTTTDRAPARQSFYRCTRLLSKAMHNAGLALQGPLFPAWATSESGAPVQGVRATWAEVDRRYDAILRQAGFAEAAMRNISLHSFHGSRAAREARAGVPMEETLANMRWSRSMYLHYTAGREPLVIEGMKMAGKIPPEQE
jgi:integrase